MIEETGGISPERRVEPIEKVEKSPKGPRHRVPPNLQPENPLSAEVQPETGEILENPSDELSSEARKIYRIKGGRITEEDIGKVPGSEFDETI